MSLDATVQVALGSLELDVRLAVAPGEVIAVLGPNGGGKTTLLRALAGFQPLDGGRIVLDDRVLDDPAAGVLVEPRRRSCGLLFQDHLLFPHLSVLDNVAFGLRRNGADRDAARRRAHEWLTVVGLEEAAAAAPRELSGGQAQRAALARRSPPNPDCCSSTSPCRRWTCRVAGRCGPSCAAGCEATRAAACW